MSRFSDDELVTIRRLYARQMLALAGHTDNPRLERAFSAVAREDYLGPPPWTMLADRRGGAPLPQSDAAMLYQNVLVQLDPDRSVNNGSPALHAHWLDALAVGPGEDIVHLGAGTGYYTALLAELAGPSGRVTAVEYDPALAAAAARNLAHYGQVSVIAGDGAGFPETPVDGIYVNFGVEQPMPAWIDQLRDGGRLVFPLGCRHGRSIHGGGFRIQRQAGGFTAEFLGPAFFVAAEAAPAVPASQRARLHAAFQSGLAKQVKSFIWQRANRANRCWFAAADWAFGLDE